MGSVHKEVANPALSLSINGDVGESVYDLDGENRLGGEPDQRTTESLRYQSRLMGTISFPSYGSISRVTADGQNADATVEETGATTQTELESHCQQTSSVLGEEKPKPNGGGNAARVPEKGNVLDEKTKNTSAWANGPPAAKEHAFSSECPCGECRKIALLAKRYDAMAEGSSLIKNDSRGRSPSPSLSSCSSQSPARSRSATPRRSGQERERRLDKSTFFWLKDTHPALHKEFVKATGAKRSDMCRQIQDMEMRDREERNPCGDDPQAAREEREERQPRAPEPVNVPHNLWAHHQRYFQHELGQRSYEIAQPDEHNWIFFFCALVLFVVTSASSLLDPWMAPIAGVVLVSILAERLSALRLRQQYTQTQTVTGERGVYRVLSFKLQVLHFVFLIAIGLLSLSAVYDAVIITSHFLVGAFWVTVPGLVVIGTTVPVCVFGWLRLRQEAVSVLRSRLTIFTPVQRAVTLGERQNDPMRAEYVVDNRPESEKGTDLTVDTVSVGRATFSVSVSCDDEDPPYLPLVEIYDMAGRHLLRHLGYGELMYSLAELEQYLTSINTNILYDYKTMHERIQNYRSGFHRVGFGAELTLRTQELRTNSAWMAAFIALSQQLILKSVAGEALPLTVRA